MTLSEMWGQNTEKVEELALSMSFRVWMPSLK